MRFGKHFSWLSALSLRTKELKYTEWHRVRLSQEQAKSSWLWKPLVAPKYSIKPIKNKETQTAAPIEILLMRTWKTNVQMIRFCSVIGSIESLECKGKHSPPFEISYRRTSYTSSVWVKIAHWHYELAHHSRVAYTLSAIRQQTGHQINLRTAESQTHPSKVLRTTLHQG